MMLELVAYVEPRSLIDSNGGQGRQAGRVEKTQTQTQIVAADATLAGMYDDNDKGSSKQSTLRSDNGQNQYTGSNFNNWNIGNGKSRHSQPQGLPPSQTRYRPKAKVKPKSSEDEGGTTAS
jgi:hypothetical protein